MGVLNVVSLGTLKGSVFKKDGVFFELWKLNPQVYALAVN